MGCHSFSSVASRSTGAEVLNVNNYVISITAEGRNDKTRENLFRYKRDFDKETLIEKLLTSESNAVTLCILPVPPLYVAENISNHLCLRFKSPLVVDRGQSLDFYAKMPVEIGIFKQSNTKGILLIDCFSLCKQQYTLYGTPESGIICSYKETEIFTSEVETSKFEEALVGIRLLNDIDKIVQISKVIIPLSAVTIDYRNNNAYLSGRVEVKVGTLFGNVVANVRILGTRIWDVESSPVQAKGNTISFLMDKGF